MQKREKLISSMLTLARKCAKIATNNYKDSCVRGHTACRLSAVGISYALFAIVKNVKKSVKVRRRAG